MKRSFLLLPLTCAVLLLSGCPDAKLPTPTPGVPKPKAQNNASYSLPDAFVWHLQDAAMPVSAKRS